MSAHLVVAGDILLDRDVSGRVTRLCPDAPVPVVDVQHEAARPGGAGLAALLARNAGADVTLVTALGADEAGATLATLLSGAGVHVVDLGRTAATVEKVRVRSGDTSLVRFDRSGTAAVAPGPWRDEAEAALRDADAVLVSDYGGGMTGAPHVRAPLTRHALQRPTVWDPHPRGADPVANVQLVTPTETELAGFEPVSGGAPRDRGASLGALERAARRLSARVHAGAVAVTMGARGAMLVDGGEVPLVVPAARVTARDVVGAGDAFACTAAGCLAAGAVVSEAVVAAVHSATTFVAAGGAAGLLTGAASAASAAHAAHDEPANAAELVARVRARAGTVVATGGCFDLLHAGHAAMLSAARTLGDCLVVLLNSDASVRRLKGRDRPYQSAADRAALLRALECVDAVEVFEEDTPAAALERLRPDVFAKGGDYAAAPLAERQVVERYGGRTVLLPYLAGRSTSRLVMEVHARGR
jgi:rfaE bifunctional protein nucleotidyltransferase chain/domain/rfaE bifunctional protein kinase chain/domain